MALDLVPYPFDVVPDGVTTRESFGYCMVWCNQTETKKGTPVEEHTVWCESNSYGLLRAHDNYGERHEVCVTRVEPYTHGTYPEDMSLALAYSKDICLTTENLDTSSDPQQLYISSAEARKLAAALIFLADSADLLDRPLPQRSNP